MFSPRHCPIFYLCIVVDVDGVNLAELINKVAENGDSLRVVDERDSTETPATYASPHQLL
ncbi:DUF5983 family protein [Escherichia coli]|uniref:DUF5983 family protein n=1 Tax=Escherichia coli TaxID=562 RepID=UPI001CBE30AE|nr:DUF5983 family protein [Escherichia coli]